MRFIKYLILFLSITIAILITAYYFYVYGSHKHKIGQAVSSPLPTLASLVPQPTLTSNFSLENAPTESLRGGLDSMVGEIDWQDRIATQEARIFTPTTIQQGDKLLTGPKSNVSLIFPNAVTIKFSEKTTIEIMQTLPANLVFSQTTGEAEYTKTGSYPVSVRTLNLLTNITGDTIVSINSDKPIITLIVKSGDVTVAYNDLKYLSHEVTITAGHTYTFNSGTRKAALK